MTGPDESPGQTSLLMVGALQRLAGVAVVIATLWLAVGWAIGMPA